MPLTKNQKIALGIATAVALIGPFLFVPIVMAAVFASLATLDPTTGETSAVMFGPIQTVFSMMTCIMPLSMCTSFLLLGLQIVYTALIVKDKRLDDTMRVIFIVGTFMFNFLMMPAYYLFYVLDSGKSSPPSADAEVRPEAT